MIASIIPVVITFASLAPAAPEYKLPAALDLTAIRAIPVQHDGRYPPLDTVARDFLDSVTGDAHFRGKDAVMWLLAWTFDPDTWMDEPLITIRNAELRKELALSADKSVFSYAELINHPRLRDLIADLAQRDTSRKPDPLESKVSDIHDKLIQLQTVFGGRAVNVIPDPADPLGAWTPVRLDARASADGNGEHAEIAAAWSGLRAAFLADDVGAFALASTRLAEAAAQLPAAFRPDQAKIGTELRYNALQPFTLAWKVMLGAALLAASATFLRRKWFDVVALIAMIAGFGALTYGLALRWQIAGRIPASNLFESLLFLSWGMGAFAVVSMLVFRDRLVPLTASGMGAVALLLATCLPMDHFIRPIAPVLLDTVWMSIHVPVIMVSYSVLALAVLIAHVQLGVMALAPARAATAKSLDTLHYWYVHVGTILLTIGIITGSMWAASSWGRYWGWDPKEVWSLAALLGYLAVMHVRIDLNKTPRWMYAIALVLLAAMIAVILPRFAPITGTKLALLFTAVAGLSVLVLARGMFGTAVKSILCFWLIVMTYVGVNFVLGIGLHSYAFGKGAVARRMLEFGAIDLAFVALCTLIYLLRRTPRRTPSALLANA
jgi:ABC-type transport system involved in cytochrome c biogenesis permease subunit